MKPIRTFEELIPDFRAIQEQTPYERNSKNKAIFCIVFML